MLSVANDAAYSPKTAQTSPITTTTEAKAEDAAAGGFGDVSGASIGEGCPAARSPPPPGG